MRKFTLSWIFPVVFILVILAYVSGRYLREGLVTTQLLSPTPVLLSTLSYKLSDGSVNTMTSHRVWVDPHGNEIWFWQEDVSSDPNLMTMKAISPQHKDQTLVLDLKKKEYKWTFPTGDPNKKETIVFPIS
jgi:hypothetical protein